MAGPRCWIGLTRFEKALVGFAHCDQVAVIYHAFRLMPGQPPLPVAEAQGRGAEMLKRRYRAYLTERLSVLVCENVSKIGI